MVDNCEAMEVNLRWDCARSSAEQYGLRFGDGLRIYMDAQQQRLVLERHYPQYGLCGTRSVPLTAGADLNLRIFFDSSSVEVFVNDGEACLSSRIYPQAPRRELALFASERRGGINRSRRPGSSNNNKAVVVNNPSLTMGGLLLPASSCVTH